MNGELDPDGGVTALVLAGSRGGRDPVAEHAGAGLKAFAEIGGRPMIAWVLESLGASGGVDDLRVSLPAGPAPGADSPELDEWIRRGVVRREESGSSPAASVRDVLEQLPPGRPLLVTTADHPLLRPETADAFLRRWRDAGADAAAGLAEVGTIRSRHPESRPTAMRFRDGAFTGCNLFAFAGAAGLPVVDFWRRLESHRKRPWRVARALGPTTLFLYAMRLLTLKAAVDRLGRRTGLRLAAIPLDDPDAGVDVDTPADFRLVDSILQNRNE